ncbi:unnamed protein product, partial [marine sediment metagenome]
PDDEKALCNCAVGHLLSEQLDDARIYAEKVLAKNSANGQAYSIIVRVNGNRDTLENLIASVPEPYRKLPDVAFAFSQIALEKNELSIARKWLEIASENKTHWQPP